MDLRLLSQPACDLTHRRRLLCGPPAFLIFVSIAVVPVGLPVQQVRLIEVPYEAPGPPGTVRPPEHVPILLLRQREGLVVVRAPSQRHPVELPTAHFMLLNNHDIAVRLGAELAVVRDAAGNELLGMALAGEGR